MRLDAGESAVTKHLPANVPSGEGQGIPIHTPLRRRVFGPEFTRNIIRWADLACMTGFLIWFLFLRPRTPLLASAILPAPTIVRVMAHIATTATFLKTFAFPIRATRLTLTKSALQIQLKPGDSLHPALLAIPWDNVKRVVRVVGHDDSTRLLKIHIRKHRVLNIHPNAEIEHLAHELRLNLPYRAMSTSSLHFTMMPLLKFALVALAVALMQQWGVHMLAVWWPIQFN